MYMYGENTLRRALLVNHVNLLVTVLSMLGLYGPLPGDILTFEDLHVRASNDPSQYLAVEVIG